MIRNVEPFYQSIYPPASPSIRLPAHDLCRLHAYMCQCQSPPTHKFALKSKPPSAPYFPAPQFPDSTQGGGLGWGLWAHRVYFTTPIIKLLVITSCTGLCEGTFLVLYTMLAGA